MSILTDADVLDEIVTSGGDLLPAEAARTILDLRFRRSAVERMNALAEKNQQGELTTEEATELDAYRRVGSLLNLLQAKARLALRETTG